MANSAKSQKAIRKILAKRKAAHLNICCNENLPIEGASTFFEHVQFLHHSLPEIDYNRISTETSFLGYRLSAPFMISCMTGGSAGGYKLNKILAMAAQEENIAIGTGSLRILLKKPQVIDHFQLKTLAPAVPVLGNIGAVQLPELFASDAAPLKQFFHILARLKLDALVVHLNAGQEIFQEDGDRNFSHLLNYISRLCDQSSLPIIVKETGAGIAPWEVEGLFRAGVRYVDVAGAGGTNWMAVEALREYAGDTASAELAGFTNWGIPTALALSAAISRCREQGIIPADGGFIASGGLRGGEDYAKAIALGANMAAAALPFIRLAKKQGLVGCTNYLREIKRSLKRAMLLSASESIAHFQNVPLLFSSQFHYRRRELANASERVHQHIIGAGDPLHPENDTIQNLGNGDPQQSPNSLTTSALDSRKFHKYSIHKRRELMRSDPHFPPEAFVASGQSVPLLDLADAMIESAIGFMPIPLGIVRGCTIDGKKHHLPLAVEEPSVLAAANYAVGMISLHGGFVTSADEPLMSASIYLSPNNQPNNPANSSPNDQPDNPANSSPNDQPDNPADNIAGKFGHEHIKELQDRIQRNEGKIQGILAELLKPMTNRGGGYRGISSEWLHESHSLRVTLTLDTRDAMGANLLNTAAEKISPFLEEITGGVKLMAIVSNQAEQRKASASFSLPLSALRRGKYAGQELGERIVKLYRIAEEDPSRAVTHNKGIMNGISGIALATANDSRAIEAAAHAWASRSGRYRSLSRYWIENGLLKASLKLPLALATVGGAVSFHPVARLSLAIMDYPDARHLARYAAALGLAQNFAALSALAGEGIQQGHMKLHAHRLAYSLGAREHEVPMLAEALQKTGTYTVEESRRLLNEIRRT